MGKVPTESIVDLEGTLKKVEKPIESCSIKNLELQVRSFYVVSRSKTVLPFQMDDAERNEHQHILDQKEGKDPKDIVVTLKTRLDHRILDLRTPASQSIFRIQSGVCQFYREYLLS